MPRTTIDIDASLLPRLKKRAAAAGKTLGAVVSELLAAALREPQQETARFHWKSKRMRARIDIEDKEALRRALDGR